MLRRGLNCFLASSIGTPLASLTPLCIGRRNLLVGSAANGQMEPIHVKWTDIVGREGSRSARLAAGSILSMLDMCAARVSQVAADYATKRTGNKYQTCTVGVTNTVFACPILHGDAVRLDARVVHCGSSSMGIYIQFFRRSPSNRAETWAGESFFTMVAITPDLKAAKIIPAMELTDPLDLAMNERYENIRKIQRENLEETRQRRTRTLSESDADCPINATKQMKVTMKSTRCEGNRIFFSAFLNNNNTVFGGELMYWMERHAVHCGQMFTGNLNVYTIGMHTLSFDEPLFATDWVTLEANVIYVRNTTMEVDVVLHAERANGTLMTNRASFVLINDDDIGQKSFIPTGIDLSRASQEELQLFAEARGRYVRSVERRKQGKQPKNPLIL